MHVCTGGDRLGLDGHVCSQSQSLPASPLRCHERRTSRQQCACSSAASTSGASYEHIEFVRQSTGKTTQIQLATRALKRAFRRCHDQGIGGSECCQSAARQCNSQSSHSGTGRCRPCKTGSSCNCILELLSELYVVCRTSAVTRLCYVLSAAILPGRGFADLGQNYVFMAGFWGWFLAQTCKVTFTNLKQIPHSCWLRCRRFTSVSCRFSQKDGAKESGI